MICLLRLSKVLILHILPQTPRKDFFFPLTRACIISCTIRDRRWYCPSTSHRASASRSTDASPAGTPEKPQSRSNALTAVNFTAVGGGCGGPRGCGPEAAAAAASVLAGRRPSFDASAAVSERSEAEPVNERRREDPWAEVSWGGGGGGMGGGCAALSSRALREGRGVTAAASREDRWEPLAEEAAWRKGEVELIYYKSDRNWSFSYRISRRGYAF